MVTGVSYVVAGNGSIVSVAEVQPVNNILDRTKPRVTNSTALKHMDGIRVESDFDFLTDY